MDNGITSISSLSDFSNIYEICLLNDRSLNSLHGLENHKTINYLICQYSGIESLAGIVGCTEIKDIVAYNTSLSTFANYASSSLLRIYANNCKLENIDALKNCINLRVVNLENNTKKDGDDFLYKLSDVDSLNNCSLITKLFLAGNSELDEDAISKNTFKIILKNCGNNYSLDAKYSLLFLDTIKKEFTNMTDSQLQLLDGNTSIRSIKISNSPQISNSKLKTILMSMTELRAINLKGLSQITDISFMNSLTHVIELDLRGTGVSDLSVLETLATNGNLTLGILLIDNEQIEIKNIQKTISLVSSAEVNTYDYSFNNLYKNGEIGQKIRGVFVRKKVIIKI